MVDGTLLHLALVLEATGYTFTTVTPAIHARVNARPANAWARNAEEVFGWSRPFHEAVLAPTLFAALRDAKVERAVDIGCGAGPGALVVALERPQAEVWAVDINPTALRYTAINARLAGADRVSARHSDLLNGVDGQFDLIVANPPYLLDAGERTYQHGGGSLGEGLSHRGGAAHRAQGRGMKAAA